MFNRNYKDTVFRLLFGSEEYKENTLALYNAVNGSHYSDPAELELTTIQDVIYMGFKNDTSFIVGSEMSLWEHQSTFNPNMPLRGLSYFAKLYESFLTRRRLRVFGTKKLILPTPRYIVFYIGPGHFEDVTELRLSDLFAGADPAVEVVATMININHGRNEKLMKACEALESYSTLVHEIRRRQEEGKSLEEAINEAVDYCISAGILEDFLRKHKAEVTDMFLTEYNEEEVKEMLRQEAWEDGMEKGLQEGREKGLAEGRKEGEHLGQGKIVRYLASSGRSEYEIAELIGLPQETVHTLLREDSSALRASELQGAAKKNE